MNLLGTPVTTADGSITLREPELGECYHSEAGARSEAEALYILGSNLPQRLLAAPARAHPAIRILDLGLGLGYNACASLEAWWQSPGHHDFYLASVEANLGLVEALLSGQGSWQSNWPALWLQWVATLTPAPQEQGCWLAEFRHPTGQGRCLWKVFSGDALDLIPSLKALVWPWDYIWQDAFSPAKSPRLWTPSWFAFLQESSSPGACLLTYSVARCVKEALTAAGWKVEKIPALGKKRAWLRAVNTNES